MIGPFSATVNTIESTISEKKTNSNANSIRLLSRAAKTDLFQVSE